jgi:hypothetical protein
MPYNMDKSISNVLKIAMSTGDGTMALDVVQSAEQLAAALECNLPIDMKPSREVFEKVGFTFESIRDNVLCKATLPAGWTIKNEGYWSYIYDDKGRFRANSFYKFWDMCGHMKLCSRFYIGYEHVVKDDVYSPVRVAVKNSDDKVVFITEESAEEYSKEHDALRGKAKEYLNQNYPDWEDPTKYWD